MALVGSFQGIRDSCEEVDGNKPGGKKGNFEGIIESERRIGSEVEQLGGEEIS